MPADVVDIVKRDSDGGEALRRASGLSIVSGFGHQILADDLPFEIVASSKKGADQQANASTAALHGLVRLLARQAAAEFWNTACALSAEIGRE